MGGVFLTQTDVVTLEDIFRNDAVSKILNSNEKFHGKIYHGKSKFHLELHVSILIRFS